MWGFEAKRRQARDGEMVGGSSQGVPFEHKVKVFDPVRKSRIEYGDIVDRVALESALGEKFSRGGTRGDRAADIELAADEYVSKVVVQEGSFHKEPHVGYIELHTTGGRVVRAGQRRPFNDLVEFCAPDGQCLVGFKGRADDYIVALRPLFGPVPPSSCQVVEFKEGDPIETDLNVNQTYCVTEHKNNSDSPDTLTTEHERRNTVSVALSNMEHFKHETCVNVSLHAEANGGWWSAKVDASVRTLDSRERRVEESTKKTREVIDKVKISALVAPGRSVKFITTSTTRVRKVPFVAKLKLGWRGGKEEEVTLRGELTQSCLVFKSSSHDV